MQQAASSKQQAASSRQQATDNRQQAPGTLVLPELVLHELVKAVLSLYSATHAMTQLSDVNFLAFTTNSNQSAQHPVPSQPRLVESFAALRQIPTPRAHGARAAAALCGSLGISSTNCVAQRMPTQVPAASLFMNRDVFQ